MLIVAKIMKIVLLKDVKNIGKMGDIKEVPDGYAKNFLIPQKSAALATAQLLARIESDKKAIERKKNDEISQAKELGEKLKGLEIKVPLKTGGDGKPFGSVTVTKVISSLKKAGFDVDKSQVLLDENIKTLGSHNVKLNLGHGVEATIKIVAEVEK